MKITAKQMQCIILMAEGLSNVDIAKELSITAETISRWKADFTFQAELNKLLGDNQNHAQNKLRNLNDTALKTIEEIMIDAEASHKDRLTACLKILEITKLTGGNIGSTNPENLEKKKNSSDFMDALSI